MCRFLICFLGIISCLSVFGCSNSFSNQDEKVAGIDFSLNTLAGETITLSELRGKKVFIDFFATWCPPCRTELKEINEIVNEYKDKDVDFEILCISVDDSEQTVKRFMDAKGYNMKVLFDNKNIAGKYGVRGIPALFLIDEKGNLVWKRSGVMRKSEILELLGAE